MNSILSKGIKHKSRKAICEEVEAKFGGICSFFPNEQSLRYNEKVKHMVWRYEYGGREKSGFYVW